ncbi:MAG: ABC transporter substrate-binding protein [Alphaproteobacteria bacterium]|nr:ABC transporter substrate-binding protein [Alphaproteobacteria bacterium]
MMGHTMIGRRRLLTLTAAGVTATAFGGLSGIRSARAAETVRWVSPRGTVEVLDDYPYWVAKKFGYFGDIETTLEPGPSDATATIKLVDQDQADVGYPSPGVFSLGLAQGMPIVSVFHMGGGDVFSFAFRKGEKPDLKGIEGKTVVLGSAGWQSICDPMLKAAGVDISTIKYVDAGWPTWGTALMSGQGDAALSWEGLRAQWKGQGLDFDYFLGRDFSKLPANSFVIRKSDFEDASKKDMYERYFRGWASGLEFGKNNPRAATQIVMEQFPGLSSQMTPDVAVESMMQLASVFGGRMDERKKWGYHLPSSWQLFFDVGREIGQIQGDFKLEDVVKNDYIDAANAFDSAKIKADADGFALSDAYGAVNVDEIAKRI